MADIRQSEKTFFASVCINRVTSRTAILEKN